MNLFYEGSLFPQDNSVCKQNTNNSPFNIFLIKTSMPSLKMKAANRRQNKDGEKMPLTFSFSNMPSILIR